MRSSDAWAHGYLEQARADIQAAKAVQGQVPSTVAMLLQMTLEKLAKAALLRSGAINISAARKSHAAARSMVQQLARNKPACKKLGWKSEVIRNQIAPIVDALEMAQPQLAGDGPCLEYPWIAANGDVRWPERDLPVARHFKPRGRGELAFRFAHQLAERFDRVYPMRT